MKNIIFKLVEKKSNEELVRFTTDGKHFFSDKLTLKNALTGIGYMSDKLYEIKNLYNEDNVETLEEAKEVMKELANKLKTKLELGEV